MVLEISDSPATSDWIAGSSRSARSLLRRLFSGDRLDCETAPLARLSHRANRSAGHASAISATSGNGTRTAQARFRMVQGPAAFPELVVMVGRTKSNQYTQQ